MLKAGDVESNPGPKESNGNALKEPRAVKPTAKCPVCTMTVKSNHKRLICKVCFDYVHAKCFGTVFYGTIKSKLSLSWTCPKCILTELPFYAYEVNNLFEMTNEDNSLLIDFDEHLEALQNRSNQLKVVSFENTKYDIDLQ